MDRFAPKIGERPEPRRAANEAIPVILRYTPPVPFPFFMNLRASSVIGWTSVVLVAAFNVFATVMKFMPVVPGSEAEKMGISIGTHGLEHGLGVLEAIITLLYVLPRTSTVGTVLMAGYLGGALATNLTHGLSITDPMLIPMHVLLLLLAVGAWFRNPELTQRLRTGKA